MANIKRTISLNAKPSPMVVDDLPSRPNDYVRTQALGGVICSPLSEVWRPDDPTLWPICSDCRRDIKLGQRYFVPENQPRLYCIPCTRRLAEGRRLAPQIARLLGIAP